MSNRKAENQKTQIGKLVSRIRNVYFWQRATIFLAWTTIYYLAFWRFVPATSPISVFWILMMMALFGWTVLGVFRRPKTLLVNKKPMKPIWLRFIAVIAVMALGFPVAVLVGSQSALAIKPYSAAELAEQKAQAIAEAKAEKIRIAAEKAKQEAEAKAAADKAAADKAAAEEKARREAAQREAERVKAEAKAAADKAAAEAQARLEAAQAAAAQADANDKAAREAALAAALAKKKQAKEAAAKAAADEKAARDAALAAELAKKKRAQDAARRIAALKNSKPLLYAVEYCGSQVFPGGGIGRYAQASDDGSTMFVTTRSDSDVYGMLVLGCVANALDFSKPLVSSIEHTSAIMGTKTWSENKFDYEWSYYPETGLNMSIIKQKDCFLGFCN